jgi:hypothetical protein
MHKPGSTPARGALLLALTAVVCPHAEVASAPPPAPLPLHATLGLYVRGADRWAAGAPAALRLAAHFTTAPDHTAPLVGADLEVTIAGSGRRQTLYRGRTDGAGSAEARFVVPAWPDGSYRVTAEVRRDAARAVEAHTVELQPGTRLLLQSDKPLYQPSQVVHLRAIGLRSVDGRPVAGRTIVFEVSDPRGNRVFRETRPASPFGVAAADFALADEITLGAYHARVEYEGGGAAPAERVLRVERYALPKLQPSLESDRAWYAPGATVHITVAGRYFFGKPVAGGRYTLTARLGADVVRVLPTVQGVLDKDGRARVELPLPPRAPGDANDLPLRLSVELTDAAAQRAEAALERVVARAPLRAALVPESREMVAGTDQMVWVLAAQPDGTPAAGAAATLRLDGARFTAVTDALGVARFRVTPSGAAEPGCGRRLHAEVRIAEATAEAERCIPDAPPGALRLRADRAFYPAGAPLALEVGGAGADGAAFIDVIKDGQTVDTATVTMRGGVGRVTLPPDERRFGTLALEAYRIAPDGSQQRAGKLVYVERPSSLTVELHPQRSDGAPYRPGERGRISMRVVDARTGRGAAAQVGLVMVDEALLALRPLEPGSARLFFTLADEALRPGRALALRPGGLTLDRLVDEGAGDDARQEAARVLLAGARAAPWTLAWETDPWQERRDADAQLGERLAAALDRWSLGHAVGERAAGHWRWRADLPSEMAAGGALAARDVRDPWGRAVTAARVEAAAGPFVDYAPSLLDRRMNAIYRALARRDARDRLAPDPSTPRAQVIARDDLERLVRDGALDAGVLVDPWGAPLRIVERKRPVRVAGLRSRFVLASSGPDGAAGSSDDLYATDYGRFGGGIRARLAGEAFAAFGTIGYGYGAGGMGYGYGRAPSVVVGSAQVRGAASAEPAPLRQNFPETMLWLPDVRTNGDGAATVDVDFADSITTWHLSADAIAADGRMGTASASVRVFQDFFVDVDLPPVATQHDELSVPVAVYNYLSTPQRVTLEAEPTPGVTFLDGSVQSIDLAPSQVGARSFRVRLDGVGALKLRVRAASGTARDAVERTLQAFPDGVERAVSFQDRLGAGEVTRTVTVPADAIADASTVTLKLYPSMATHVIEGLDSMLRMPGGCFEQTSSTNYPNALILDTLRRSGKSSPAVEKKARAFLAAGMQRLVSFEVPGGGFSWFGSAPANQILTAYGLEEFHDVARVFPVDERIIRRTREWLERRQRADGSWAPDRQFINEGATNHFNHDEVRITAYIALALRHTGGSAASVARAAAFVRRARPVEDPYTLALVAELLGGDGPAEQLWQTRRDEGRVAWFTAVDKTPTYGDGRSGTVETTARAALALLQAPAPPLARVERAVGYLVGAKDTLGNWYSTQATILSLKALLAYEAQQKSQGRGELAVAVDGEPTARLRLDGAADALQVVDLARARGAGSHTVELRYQGTGEVGYQLVARYYQPHAAAAAPLAAPPLAVATELDADRLRSGGALTERVRVTARAPLEMPIVTAGLPPGFDVDGDALDALVSAHVVDKVQRTPREVIFYLTRIPAGRPLVLPLQLRARFPVDAEVPAPTVYEYYRPEQRALGAPKRIRVES